MLWKYFGASKDVTITNMPASCDSYEHACQWRQLRTCLQVATTNTTSLSIVLLVVGALLLLLCVART
jgi:hypothetical protein